jgi:1,5-anhydro-D-fructose reductase (1,5-anhydro-D-mannitol-forming)
MIGTGRIVRRMVRAIDAVDGARVVAVLSRDQDNARAFAAEHGIDRGVASVDSLVTDPDVDVVYVASPNGLHRDHAVAAARAGKHVFCEKQMANDGEGCREIIKTCADNDVNLGLAFPFRHHPAHASMRTLARSGQFGELVFADVSLGIPAARSTPPEWYSDPSLARGGVLALTGVHRIDLLRYLLDANVVEVAATVAGVSDAQAYEDTVSALLTFDNGAVATVRFALRMEPADDSITVHGRDGWITGHRTLTAMYPDQPGEVRSFVTGDAVPRRQSFDNTDLAELYRREIADFGECVRSGAQPTATGQDGLQAVEICEAILRAGRERSTISVTHTGAATGDPAEP